jgi:integrase/recombinase XerD
MSDECISPLRRRMIEDMTVRKFTQKTQSDYIRVVKNFTIFLGRSPDTASNEDLRRFQLHLSEKRVGAPTINLTISALRFFFTVTLDRTDAVKHLTFVAEPRKIPVVLSPEEVVRFLEAAPGVKYKAALSVAYGAGLRVSEVATLKVSDIDSERMMLRVEQGKGRKDRHAMLSPVLLDLLRDWWRIARPTAWLFTGQDPLQPISRGRRCSAPMMANGTPCPPEPRGPLGRPSAEKRASGLPLAPGWPRAPPDPYIRLRRSGVASWCAAAAAGHLGPTET